jgi:hypothetical protein
MLSDSTEITMANNGKKLGTTKKNWFSPKSQSRLCKRQLFDLFKQLLQPQNTSNNEATSATMNKTESNEPIKSYHEAKQISKQYQQTKQLLITQVFRNWVKTPERYSNFV